LVQNSVTKRFISTLYHLQAQGKVSSIRQFSLSLDFFPQSLNDILKGRRDVTVELIRKAIVTYNFSPQFLFTGEGAMISTDLPVAMSQNDCVEVPFVSLESRRDYLMSDDNINSRQSLPFITLPLPSALDHDYCAFEVGNDHLNSSLTKGEIIVCRKIDPSLWMNKMYNDFCYCIVTADDIIIERIINSIGDDNTIILNRSIAEMNQRDIMDLSEIKEVWEIKMRITHDIPQPNNVKYRTDQQISDFSTVLEKQCETISSLHVTINRLLKQNRVNSY
jgi:hypothetical protein